ncbi:MAG: PH domain-containing protein [Anaerolineales bacterium]|jgi:hypothetical protein
MDNQTFTPPRQHGLFVNLGIILGLALLGLAMLSLAAQTSLGMLFLVFLLGALILIAPIPTLVSRTYALIRSSYQISRDGIYLKWGFREAAIPVNQINFVELAEDYLHTLKFPRLQWPGAITGENTQEHLGQVEFLASEKVGLVMIGTPDRVFIISPEKPKQFVLTYRKMIELGSIAPFPAISKAPSFFLVEIWRNLPLRGLLIATMILSLALFVLVAWAIPSLTQVSLGFDAQGQPLPPVSPSQLFLLPALNLILVIASYMVSLWFYRTAKDHPFVIALWGANAFTAMLFLIAVLFILAAS